MLATGQESVGVPAPGLVPTEGRRSYLFLQGPVGPFFCRLGRRLAKAGHRVLRVNFHGGDIFDWWFPNTRLYRGTAEEWPQFVSKLLIEEQVTDLVVFADCRPLHTLAIEMVRRCFPSVQVHVFEEGYLRPDWITLERDGVNARSPLMKVRERWIEQPEALIPSMPAERVGNSAFAQSLHAIGYYCSSWLTAGFFPNYKHHRQSWAQGEAWSWVTRTLNRPFRLRRAKQREQALINSDCPFFLLLLQINCDKQILVHSPIKSMRSLLESVVPSFAAHAPKDCKLVVKVHPLDSGMWPHEADLMELATAHGIADRVVFLDGSDLVLLLERCRGAITINSTAGVSALHMEVPLFAFGEAIYNSPELTHQGTLDCFWLSPQRPNRRHYWAFRRVVAHRSQINGGFYTSAGIDMALPAVVRSLGGMLTEEEQGERIPPSAIASEPQAHPSETILHGS